MKVLKGGDRKRPEVQHPKPKGAEALRAGIEHLGEHHREGRHEKPMRSERKEG